MKNKPDIKPDIKADTSAGRDRGESTTLMEPLLSVKLSTNEAAKAHVERSDVCAVPSAAVIGESLLALVLTEAILQKFGGDSMGEILVKH